MVPSSSKLSTDPGLPRWSMRLIGELDEADARAQRVAAGLNRSQLNWQPSPNAWSVGQCLDHLRIGNEVMLQVISDALQDRLRKPVDTIALGWLSQWFIRSFIAPNPGGPRAKAPSKIVPASQLDPSVLQGFLRSTESARAAIRQAGNYDVNHIRYRNPFVPLLRFTVGTGFEIIAKHAARHLLQAEGVRNSAAFPR